MMNAQAGRRAIWGATLVTLLFSALTIASPAPGEAVNQFPAFLLAIEGDGSPQVKKKSGVLESAGARGKLYVGDRIVTDARSAVHLMLNDGTILKVGLNTELVLDQVSFHGKFLSWVFRLTRGSLRGRAEKLSGPGEHLRVQTPAGSVAARGTEFVISFDPAESTSRVFALEGSLRYGAAGCDDGEVCVDVTAGKESSFKTGQAKPDSPHAFDAQKMFGVVNGVVGPETEARMALFRDARKVIAKFMQAADPISLQTLLTTASAELASAQDRAIGRGKQQREDMFQAAQEGSLYDTLAAADAYLAARDLFPVGLNGGAEDLVGPVMAAKFRLGQMVKLADAAGLFLDKIKGQGEGQPKWSGRTFHVRKTVDYERAEAAKRQRPLLEQATEEYVRTLEYVEALPAEAATKDPAAKKSFCANTDCRLKIAVHELETGFEGVANAYQQKKNSEGSGSNPGMIKTAFFARTIMGNGCFQARQTCAMKACTGGVKKCKPGELLQVCETKQIPVRCADKNL